MEKARGLANSFLWLTVSSGITLLVASVYRPIIAQTLGPTEYGRYSFIQTFITYFLALAHFGVRSVVMRETARNPQNAWQYLRSGFIVRVITMSTAVLLCCAVGYALQRGSHTTVGIFVMSITIITLSTGDLLEGVLVAFQRSFYIAISSLIGSVSRLLLGIWVLRAGYGVMGVLWILVLTSGISAVLDWCFALKAIKVRTGTGIESLSIRFVFKEALPFFIYSVTAKIYAKNDVFILTLFKGDKTTGLYCAAYIFVDLVIVISSNAALAAFPVVAKMHGDTRKCQSNYELVQAYERLHKYMLLWITLTCALLASVSSEALLLIFGKSYLGSVSSMRVLSWVPVVETSCIVTGTFLSACYQQKVTVKITITMMLVNVVFTALLISYYSAIGAAIATVAVSALSALIHYFYFRRLIGNASFLISWVKPLMCGFIVYVAMEFVGTSQIIQFMTGLASLGAVFVIVRPLDQEDIRLLRSIIRR